MKYNISLENKIKWLCAAYTCCYYENVYDLINPRLTLTKDYLKYNTTIDEEDINKFIDMYNKWIGYDMDCVENNLKRSSPNEWIYKNWNN